MTPDTENSVLPDAWQHLAPFTAARIALGRCGVSLPTRETLRFALAHAQARDAVHLALDVDALAQQLAQAGFETMRVASAAADRLEYLQRPDRGRCLSATSRTCLAAHIAAPCDLVFVVGDGLSSRAIMQGALPFLIEMRAILDTADWRIAPVILATQARVALGDEVGAALSAQAVVMLIGERPGLSSPDSMGAYLTWAPRSGRLDAERNCLSNIRPEGLSYPVAARKLAWLLQQARTSGLTGVGLKDESDEGLKHLGPACPE
jgi:ethanolamine ammonia-lyase small subunit